MKEHCNARNIENRKGKIPNTDQGRVLEGFLCDQHLNLFECMFMTFLKMFRGAQDTFVRECLFNDVIIL